MAERADTLWGGWTRRKKEKDTSISCRKWGKSCSGENLSAQAKGHLCTADCTFALVQEVEMSASRGRSNTSKKTALSSFSLRFVATISPVGK